MHRFPGSRALWRQSQQHNPPAPGHHRTLDADSPRPLLHPPRRYCTAEDSGQDARSDGTLQYGTSIAKPTRRVTLGPLPTPPGRCPPSLLPTRSLSLFPRHSSSSCLILFSPPTFVFFSSKSLLLLCCGRKLGVFFLAHGKAKRFIVCSIGSLSVSFSPLSCSHLSLSPDYFESSPYSRTQLATFRLYQHINYRQPLSSCSIYTLQSVRFVLILSTFIFMPVASHIATCRTT